MSTIDVIDIELAVDGARALGEDAASDARRSVTADDVLDMHELLSATTVTSARCWRPAVAGRRRAQVTDDTRFAHASEAELARILDYYGVSWEYEPRTFPIMWNLDGKVVESFSPDFYLPELEPVCRADDAQAEPRAAQEPQAAPAARAVPGHPRQALLRQGLPRADAQVRPLRAGRVAQRARGPGRGRPRRPRRAAGRSCGRPSRSRPWPARPRAPVADVGAESPTRRRRAPSSRGSRRRRGRRAFRARARHRITPARSGRWMVPRMTHSTRVPDLRADIGEVLVSEEQIRAKVARAGCADQSRTTPAVGHPRERPQGLAAVHGRPDARHRDPRPDRPDGGLVVRRRDDRDVGPGAHPQGPVSSIDRRASDVLIVEDIIDTGLTLNYLLRYLRGKNPATLRICALLDKPARRLVEIPIDYTRLHDPRRVRRRLRPRLRRVLPQPAVHRRAAARAVRDS